MDNNKTIVLNSKEKADNASSDSSPIYSSMSSNKTIILSNQWENEEEIKSENKSFQINSKSSGKETFFADYFQLNQTNELLGYASPLISFINRIRNLKEVDSSLFETAIELVNDYIRKLEKAQIKTQLLQSASYMLCMAIDESALKSPWCYSSPWTHKGILHTFFQQTHEDDYFLNLIEYYLSNQNKNKDILELLGVCLSICSRGNGNSQTKVRCENYRHKILNVLKNHYPASFFSPNAIPSDQSKKNVKYSMPLWMMGLLSLAVLSCIYISFRTALSIAAEPATNKIINHYQNRTMDNRGSVQ